MNEERDRVWRVLIWEINFQMASRKLWEDHPTISDEQRKEQLFGFDCQISALAVLGSKLFGYKKEHIIQAASSCTKSDGSIV